MSTDNLYVVKIYYTYALCVTELEKGSIRLELNDEQLDELRQRLYASPIKCLKEYLCGNNYLKWLAFRKMKVSKCYENEEDVPPKLRTSKDDEADNDEEADNDKSSL